MGVATTSGLLRRPYSIMRNTINTSTIHASVQQADRKMTTPARLYRRVVRVLPCYEKPEMGARHHESKLQVEGFRLVVAEKGMRTNVKNAHGLLRGFVPSHLEAVDEFVRSYASRVKKRPTTNARPLGNDLVAYRCTRLQATSFGATKLRIAIGKGRNERRRSAFKRSEAISVP